MPVRISALLEKEATTDVVWDGDTIEITFRPAAFTGGFLVDLTVQMMTNQEETFLANWLSETLTGWNLADDDDKLLPVDQATMTRIPRSLLMAFVKAIRYWNIPTESE